MVQPYVATGRFEMRKRTNNGSVLLGYHKDLRGSNKGSHHRGLDEAGVEEMQATHFSAKSSLSPGALESAPENCAAPNCVRVQ